MQAEPMIAKGIRLPGEVWEAIELEAESLQMTRSEYLRRRLSSLFRVDPDSQKVSPYAQKTSADLVELPK